MHRFSDRSEELDTFQSQQELFQPCQLRYAKNLTDLLTDELASARELLGRYQRDNLELSAMLDDAQAATYRTRSEYQQWHVYQNACRTTGTEKGNRLLPLLPEMVTERIHHGLVEEIARLKDQLSNARKTIHVRDLEVNALKAEIMYRSSGTAVTK